MGSSNVQKCQCSSFTNDKGLFQDIEKRGMTGPLTLIVEGDLLETGTYSLIGAKTNGYSLSVRTSGSTLHTIDASGYDIATFKLDSVQNFTIDGSDAGVGKYLRFRNKTALNNWDTICNIRINGPCQNIAIRNAIFEHQSYFEYNNSAAIYIAGSNNQQLTIADNLFQETAGSISWPKQHIMSVDSSSTVIIKRNEFSNFLAAGVNLVYGQNWIIDSNHFYRTKNPVGVMTYFTPILAGGGGHIITNNYIGGKSPYMAGGLLPLYDNGPFTIAGIMLAAPAGARPILVEKNHINNISATSAIRSIPSMFAGIFANANPAIIRGNIIGSTDTSMYGIQVLAASLTGISVWGNRPANITNNTIGGLTTNSQPGYGNDIKMAGIYTSLADTVIDTIIGNKIFHLKNMSNAPSIFDGGTVGINVIGGLKNIIEQNTISDLYVTQTTVSGISINRILGTGLSTIRRNRIFDLYNTNISIRSCCDFDDYGKSLINGIVMREINGDLEVGNNQISLTNRQIANPVTVRGIYSAGSGVLSSRHNIIYNSIYISGNAQENNASAAISTYGEPVTRIHNNLFVNQRKGGSLGHFIYRIQYFPPSDALAATKLNNNFYVLSDTTHFSQWGYIPSTSWQQWRLNTVADDSSSTKPSSEVPVSQLFVNKNVGNLSINTGDVTCWAINDKGIPFSYEPDDYDSTGVRAISLPAYTDIGSDEFVPLASSPGIACGCTCQSFTARISGAVAYQWEVDAGAGFQSISDDAIYHGAQNVNLQVQNAPTAWYGYKYRCIVTTATNTVINDNYELQFTARWTGAVSTSWSDPANWECGIFPDGNRDVYINAGIQNYPVLDTNATCRTVKVEEGANLIIGAGYTLTITH